MHSHGILIGQVTIPQIFLTRLDPLNERTQLVAHHLEAIQ
jgi:hypothetical protein